MKKNVSLKEISIKKSLIDSESKISVSLKMPISLKNELQSIANENSITLSSLIISTLKTVFVDK